MNKHFKYLWFLLVAVILVFALFEAVLRYSKIYYTYAERVGKQYVSQHAVTNPGWYFHHKPNEKMLISFPEFQFYHVMDSLGFRNNQSDTSKVEILVFGDSFTEGLGASQDSTWPAQLSGFRGTHIYNAGIMGSDPFYAWKILVDNYLDFTPKKLLLVVNYSDIADVIIRGGKERFLPNNAVKYKSDNWFEPIYKYSHLFRAFLHLVLRYDYILNSPVDRNENLNAALNQLIEIIAEINSICVSRQIDFQVFIQPYPQEYYQNMDSRLNFALIENIKPELISRGIKTISLRNCFENDLKSKADWLNVSWPIDGHFNAKGYRVMAEEISKQLN